MKFFQILLFIIFSFSINAEDIREYEIEGMSIGDSLLDYFSEDEIIKNIVDYYKDYDNKFSETEFYNPDKFKNYETLSIAFKTNDKKYIIYGVRGAIFFDNNIEGCYDKRDEISIDLQNLFSSEEIYMEGPDFLNHPADKSGESTASGISFFKNEDTILLDCIDWSEKLPYTDNLTLNIRTKEFNYWLPN